MFGSSQPHSRRGVLSRLLLLPLASIAAAALLMIPALASAQTGTVDFSTSLTKIQGFGFAEAFGESNAVIGLSAEQQGPVLGDASYEAQVTIVNHGIGTAQDLRLLVAQLAAATGMPEPGDSLPEDLGSIAPGGSLTTFLNFSPKAGSPGRLVQDLLVGLYRGGAFSEFSFTVLP
jgi:hypothetical protein